MQELFLFIQNMYNLVIPEFVLVTVSFFIQVSSFSKWGQYYQPKTFMNRLVGTEDDQLTSIRSPYTAR